MKKKVLIFAKYYIPSVKGGGPIQSIKNLVDNLSDKLDFCIVTTDRDLGDDKPFSNIKSDQWLIHDNVRVIYVSPSRVTWKNISNLCNSIDYDFIYLNSFFSYKFSILPIILNKFNIIHKKSIVVAPRGEFSQGALKFKSIKKRIFINVAKTFRIYKNVIWHATTEIEKNDIQSIFGDKSNIKIASNLTCNYQGIEYKKSLRKNEGEIKISFISRINQKKNLLGAIEYLNYIKGEIEFNIYGPLEDEEYWSRCKKMIAKLPENVRVSYRGVIHHDSVIDIFKEHHVFLFPTFGENFGHVITEALIGGCPVIISDKTPWKELEKDQVGWDIDLNDRHSFIDVLQYCTNMGNEEYKYLSNNAFEYAKKTSNREIDIKRTYNLFS